MPESNQHSVQSFRDMDTETLAKMVYCAIDSPSSVLAERVKGLLEQLEAERSKVEVLQHIVDGYPNLKEQLETQKDKMNTLYAGYSAKCERWSLGTCDNVHPVTLCRICQFFTDLGYESFEVTSGGLRSWRERKPLDPAVLGASSPASDPDGPEAFAGTLMDGLEDEPPYPATRPEGSDGGQ